MVEFDIDELSYMPPREAEMAAAKAAVVNAAPCLLTCLTRCSAAAPCAPRRSCALRCRLPLPVPAALHLGSHCRHYTSLGCGSTGKGEVCQ